MQSRGVNTIKSHFYAFKYKLQMKEDNDLSLGLCPLRHAALPTSRLPLLTRNPTFVSFATLGMQTPYLHLFSFLDLKVTIHKKRKQLALIFQDITQYKTETYCTCTLMKINCKKVSH